MSPFSNLWDWNWNWMGSEATVFTKKCFVHDELAKRNSILWCNRSGLGKSKENFSTQRKSRPHSYRLAMMDCDETRVDASRWWWFHLKNGEKAFKENWKIRQTMCAMISLGNFGSALPSTFLKTWKRLLQT